MLEQRSGLKTDRSLGSAFLTSRHHCTRQTELDLTTSLHAQQLARPALGD